MPRLRKLAPLGLLILCAGCRLDMHVQPRYNPLAKSDFFADGMGARPPVEGTVARGELGEDHALRTGIGKDGTFIAALPVPLTRPLLLRGRERYEIFCAPCHGRVGDGQGMIVERGFKTPPSFHIDRLRAQPIGYLFDVATNGFGEMSGYAAQVPAADRWAIAAYLRALQVSQFAPVAGIPARDRAEIDKVRP